MRVRWRADLERSSSTSSWDASLYENWSCVSIDGATLISGDEDEE